jgi:hypothetical protein
MTQTDNAISVLTAQKLHTFWPKVAKFVQNQTKIKVAET